MAGSIFFLLVTLMVVVVVVNGFTTTTTPRTSVLTSISARVIGAADDDSAAISRRQWLASSAAAIVGSASLATNIQPAYADDEKEEKNKKPGVSLEDSLYLILRVREATQQETRLITTGKFKDIQRANVKLAVSMMVTNYRLSDNINTAAAYLPTGNSMKAINTGQAAVQNLQTILEYFDTSDVQNLKVNEASMSGEKQALVLKGLESAKTNLDAFISFFPIELVDSIKQRIQNENELNRKEFDPTLGDILNLPK